MILYDSARGHLCDREPEEDKHYVGPGVSPGGLSAYFVLPGLRFTKETPCGLFILICSIEAISAEARISVYSR